VSIKNQPILNILINFSAEYIFTRFTLAKNYHDFSQKQKSQCHGSLFSENKAKG